MSGQVKVSINITSLQGLLTLLFVVLKLFGAINWSWLWVLSPIWLPLCVVIFALGIIALLMGTSFTMNMLRTRK